MGILKPFNRTAVPVSPERLPSGCFAVHRLGGIVSNTLPSHVPPKVLTEISRTVMDAFKSAAEANVPLSDLHVRYNGLTIVAREMRGGVLVFVSPRKTAFKRPTQHPAMSYKNLDEFILHLEAHIECWKHFNHYVNLARDKKFTPDDEAQFLDLKSLITQGTEAIASSDAKGGPRKEDVLALFATAPSLRYLSDMSDSIPSVEGQWHRIYLALQSLLGQVKVQQNKAEEKGGGWSLFGRK
jgi:hypothetical protein